MEAEQQYLHVNELIMHALAGDIVAFRELEALAGWNTHTRDCGVRSSSPEKCTCGGAQAMALVAITNTATFTPVFRGNPANHPCAGDTP
jgi:hypothetical protein